MFLSEVPLSKYFQLKHQEEIYDGKIIQLTVDQIKTSSGLEVVREVVHHPGGVGILPLLPNEQVLLVKQFRYPIQKSLLEIPAGKIDPGESPEFSAARELQEEVGFRAGSLEKLTEFYTTPGFCNERLHLYLAKDLDQCQAGSLDEEEEITICHYSFDEVFAFIRSGKIIDAKTLIAFQFLFYRGF